MTAPRFIQIHTLHSYPAALLNRDDAGLAKRMPFGGVERTRVSSQCLKRHWRMANDPFALRTISPDIGVSVRSRRVWSVKVADALVAEGIDQKAVEAVLKAMQDDLYGQSKKAQATAKDTDIDLDRSELVVLGFKEIEYLKQETRRIVALTGTDSKKIEAGLKDLRKNFHALIAGAGIDAAMFGRFVSGDRDARVDAAVHVAHAFTVHAQASEPDYFTAVDDLQAEEQGSGAGHLNTAELTSGVYYGYVVVDVPSLVANLEGCTPKRWLDSRPYPCGQGGRASRASDRQGDAGRQARLDGTLRLGVAGPGRGGRRAAAHIGECIPRSRQARAPGQVGRGRLGSARRQHRRDVRLDRQALARDASGRGRDRGRRRRHLPQSRHGHRRRDQRGLRCAA